MSIPNEILPDIYVAEFLDLAESANVHFDIVGGRLVMRQVNPIDAIWRPCRHLLDEIGTDRILAYLKARPEGAQPSRTM